MKLLVIVAAVAVTLATPSCQPLPPRAAAVAQASLHTAFRAAELVASYLKSRDLDERQLADLEKAQRLLDVAVGYLDDLDDAESHRACKVDVGAALKVLRGVADEVDRLPPEVVESLALAEALAR